jgi:hypothetical protein
MSSLIGKGGMGDVFRARDMQLCHPIAGMEYRTDAVNSVPTPNAVDANLWSITEGPFFPYILRDVAERWRVLGLFHCER